jgi:single-strand DNA-binding protein
MANETTVTIIGTLVGDPELRYTTSGTSVANFTVASNPRIFHKDSGEWRDGEPIFLRCALWRQPAEHVTDCLSKGDRVIVQGRLQQRNYETQSGDKRTAYELLVDEIGASLRYAKVTVTKTSRNTTAPTADEESA